MYVSRLDVGLTIEHEFGDGRGGYLYVVEGDIGLDGERMTSGDAAKITSAGLLRIRGHVTSELIFVDTPL